jgi:hypothetical protein
LEAKEALIRDSVGLWGGLSEKLLQAITPVLKDLLERLVEDLFGAHKTGMLCDNVK